MLPLEVVVIVCQRFEVNAGTTPTQENNKTIQKNVALRLIQPEVVLKL